jgi:hypothetical protein
MPLDFVKRMIEVTWVDPYFSEHEWIKDVKVLWASKLEQFDFEILNHLDFLKF